MSMLAAFLVGYWMGTRAGEDGMRKLRDAGIAVLRSDEFRTTVAGVAGMARDALRQGLDIALAPEPARPHAA
ncbi:MAG: hypothetical protein J2P20_06575 [Pseudonocardia sp.]|nr:hypothetical protein [Pseudonocardia sp.]